jgi:hypothetical protein
MAQIGVIIGLVITLVFGLALAPVVQDSATSAAENSTGPAVTMYNLFPLIYAAVLVGVAVGALALGYTSVKSKFG